MQSVTVSSIEGNRRLLDGGAMFGNAPKEMWQKWHRPDKSNRIELACRGFLFEISGTKILLETGIGAFFDPKMADRFGVTPPDSHILLKSLSQKGIDQSEVDFVILSHLHFDHAGGLLPSYLEDPKKSRLLFPNAKYIVGESAWERANTPHGRDRASFIPEIISLLRESNRLNIIRPDKKETWGVFPKSFSNQIDFKESNGHTPGQLHTVIKSKNMDFFFCGDLIPGRTWAHIPLTMGYDRFPELLIDEKRSLYSEMDLNRTLFLFTHDCEIVGSKITKNEKGKYQTVNELEKLNKLVC